MSSNVIALNTTEPILTAITGGIGSGKSVVSRILRILGYPVYDCDSRAKVLMDADETIKQHIIYHIDSEAVGEDGAIDRRRLAATVFADAEKLALLNAAVHASVKLDLMCWAKKCKCQHAFVETAIMFQSGLNEIVTDEWRVDAPLEIRIDRVMKRNSLSRAEVELRIAAQEYSLTPDTRIPPLHEIINDGSHPIMPQIQQLLTLYAL